MSGDPRVLVIGLDCAEPSLVFDRYRDRLPTLRRLMGEGVWGRLRSCEPPITIPAWMVMATSRSPGSLGLYGFRHRAGPSYTDGWIADSRHVAAPKLWDHLGAAGKRVVLVGIPPSYPPQPVPGWSVGCFITPDASRPYTYPASLKPELEAAVGPYAFDVTFRTDDRDALLRDLYDMTAQHFRALRHLLTTRGWDYAHAVEIGTDRIHHAFWKFCDPAHRKYVPGNRHESAIMDYYRFVDSEIAALLDAADDGRTTVLVVSDHGAKAMTGCFAVNEWLQREGYLRLAAPVEGHPPIERHPVDWSRTTAWGWGGYYARIFLNLEGREAQGTVPRSRREAVRDELRERLLGIRGPGGEPWATRVHAPEDLYPRVTGDAPDLLVYFDDLRWRSAGTLGWEGLYLEENDTGPDDAVHAHDGIFVMREPARSGGGRELAGLRITDVAPTVLRLFGLPVPAEMEGHPLEALA